jgi:predicted DNA-binding transcriptional regulator AlpA
MNSTDRLLRRSDVKNITGMTRYMIDMLEEHGGFPKRMQVGRRAVFWSEAEVIGFIEQTKQMRGGGL